MFHINEQLSKKLAIDDVCFKSEESGLSEQPAAKPCENSR
jgi:hypothetical protein